MVETIGGVRDHEKIMQIGEGQDIENQMLTLTNNRKNAN